MTLPPNILYVVLEDFSTLASPAFTRETAIGGSLRRTPTLERLASRSVLFRRAYCQAPICNPSRTSFLTGRRPTATGVYGNDDSFPNSLPTLVDVLREADPSASIACAGGKIFHVACDRETRGFISGSHLARNTSSGFTDLNNARLARAIEDDAAGGGSCLSGAARRNLQLTLHGTPPHSSRTHDMEKTAVAIRLLAAYAAERQRFFIGVGLSSTHVQGISPADFRICTPAAAAAEAARPLSQYETLAPSRANEHHPPLVTWQNWDVPRFDVGWRWQREAIGSYYACATHIDNQLGALLATLSVLRLGSSTSVVVHGDHGFSLGRHGRWSKYHLYEDATRVPLLIAAPGQPPRAVDDVVEGLDVMPTLLDLWGVPRAPRARAEKDGSGSGGGGRTAFTFRGRGTSTIELDGTSLMPYLSPPPSGTSGALRCDGAWRAAYARSELRMGMVQHRPSDPNLPGAKPMRSLGHGAQLYLRTPRYAYTLYLSTIAQCACASPDPAVVLDEALFDHDHDEGEARNLAYEHSERSVRDDLLQVVLREWRLHELSVRPPNRSARIAHIEQLAECFARLALAGDSCHQSRAIPGAGRRRG